MEISSSTDPVKGALIALSRGSPPLRMGEILKATVISGTPEARIGGRAVIRIAHQTLEVRSQLSLHKGDQLILKVTQVQTGLQLTVEAVNGTAPGPVTDPLLAHLARLRPQQGGYAVLLAALGALARPEIAAYLPEGPRGLLQRLLASIHSREALARPEALRAAIRDAGPFFEARLALGDAFVYHDLKAALLRLVGALGERTDRRNRGGTPPPKAPTPHTDPPPPDPHAGPLPQPRARLHEAETLEALGTPHNLRRLAEGVLARMTLHQIATLESAEAGHPAWLLELPIRNEDGLDLVHLRIGEERRRPTGEGHPQWSADLALDLPGLGPVQVRISTDGDRVSSAFWVQRASTAQTLEAGLESLRCALEARGLQVTALACRQGPPPESRHRAGERHVIDTRA
jgi:hypothetical protein